MRAHIERAIEARPDEPAMQLLWWDYFYEDMRRLPGKEASWYFNQPEVKARLQGFDAAVERYPASPTITRRRWDLAVYWGEPDAEQIRLARLAADNYVTAAMVDLAERRRAGRGLPRSEAAAARWFCRAAQYGNGVALLNLSNYYTVGTFGPPDLDRAADYAQQAIDAGVHEAGLAYKGNALFLQDKPGEAYPLLLEAAQHGHPLAIGRIGEMHVTNRHVEGFEAKPTVGIRLLQTAGENGFPSFFVTLATCADLGVGFGERNPAYAAGYLRAAWKAGVAGVEVKLRNYLAQHPELRQGGDPR